MQSAVVSLVMAAVRKVPVGDQRGVMRRGACFSFGMALLAALAGEAAADAVRPAPTDWTLTLGVEGRLMPSYDGSDRYVLRPIPLIDLRRAGTARSFSSSRDGASIGVFDNGNLRVGLTGKVRLPRRENDDADLRGLGNVDWAFEAGVFAEYYPVNWLRTRIDVRRGFGGHHGVVGDLSADVVMPVSPRLTLSGGPRLTAVSAAANDPYFSINAAQSAASGLPVYTASGGLRSYGAGGMARYEWSPRWATHFFAEYEHLTGSAAQSPLVTQRGNPNQVQFGLGATYSFDVPGLW